MSPHSADQTEDYWKDTAKVWQENAAVYVGSGGGRDGVEKLRTWSHVVDLEEEY